MELLEEADRQTRKTITPPPAKPDTENAPDADSESDSEYFDAVESHSSHGDSDSDVDDKKTPSSSREPEAVDLEGFIQVKPRIRKAPPQPPLKLGSPRDSITDEPAEWEQIKYLNSANTLAAEEKRYDLAEKQLRSQSYKRCSYLWFLQQDNLCWLDYLKATDSDYLVDHSKNGEFQPLAKRMLKQTEEKIFRQINTLATLVGSEAFAGSVEQDGKKCLKIADALEKKGPRFRRQYGGLYSKLGHLRTALKNITPPGDEFGQYAREGSHFYKLANAIRRRPESSEGAAAQ